MNVIITGAGKGLALELVKIHAKKSDLVYALAHSLTNDLKELSDKYKNVITFVVELTDEESVKTILNNIKEPIDTIYNVAGIWYSDQVIGIEETDMQKVKNLYLVNAVACLHIMKYGKRLLKENGILLNVSSEEGSIGEIKRKGNYGYSMSKAALNMASKIFQNEAKEKHIKVYCYHPGWLKTQMGGEKALASSLSISAEESANILYSYLYLNKNKIAGMFFDYKNKKREW